MRFTNNFNACQYILATILNVITGKLHQVLKIFFAVRGLDIIDKPAEKTLLLSSWVL
jgi:hypothetical protein